MLFPKNFTIMKIKKRLLVLTACVLFSQNAFADEQLFGYLQGSEVMPEGGKQLYQWATQRQGRSYGKFDAQDYRTEFEYGLTNKLQGSLYLNGRSFHSKNSTYEDRNDALYRYDGVSAALKYNVLSPFKPNDYGNIGLALYVEPGYSTVFNVDGSAMNSPYVETKIILQKNFLEDRLVTAFNLENDFVKRQFRVGDRKWQNDLELNMYAGISYMVHSNWYLGLEGRYHSEYPQTYDSNGFNTVPRYGFRQQYVKWVGPNVHYASKNWWFTFTWLTQVGGGGSNNDYANGNLYLIDHERNEFRVKIAYNF